MSALIKKQDLLPGLAMCEGGTTNDLTSTLAIGCDH